jgi:hypothetical protein
VPIVVVFSWALWRSGMLGRAALNTVLGLVAIDALALFSNLLPLYYWSAFWTRLPRLALPPDGRAAWALFWNRLQMDKPAGWLPVMVTLPVVYGLWLLLTGGLAVHTRLGATHEQD